MTDDVKPANEVALSQPTSKPEIRLEDLPELLPQQQLMLHYILNGSDYVTAYRKAGYTSVNSAKQSAHVLVTRNPLKAHLDYFTQELSKIVTPAYIANKLRNMLHESTDKEDAAFYNPEIGIKALDMLNKMAGNYAATQVNVQTLSASIEDIRNARSEYKKES